jgi:DNA-binding transcriptional ArsR family regulator
MIDDVFKNGGEPPVNKIRKVIFKDYSMLTINEKLSIVGKLIGRSSRVDDEAIYQCMLDLNDLGKHICIGRIAGLLNVSKRTIYRHINDELKQEIKILNEEI